MFRATHRIRDRLRIFAPRFAGWWALVLVPGQAVAQSPAGRTGEVSDAPAPPATATSSRPFEIVDNSFFIEEAFNQEPGVFQNIFGLVRSDRGAWELAFTQEWPVGTQRHQLSFTVPFAGGEEPSGIGHVFLHYRLQALTETGFRPAFAPRVSLVIPTGDEEAGFGDGALGVQGNLPFSKQVGDLYLHGNAGLTFHPHDGIDVWTTNVGASVIYRVRPMVNVLLETVATFDELNGPGGAGGSETAWFLSPGVRGGWNLGDHQLILGGAVAVGLTDATDDVAFFGYLSYELPFRR